MFITAVSLNKNEKVDKISDKMNVSNCKRRAGAAAGV